MGRDDGGEWTFEGVAADGLRFALCGHLVEGGRGPRTMVRHTASCKLSSRTHYSRQFSFLGQNFLWNGQIRDDSVQDSTEIPADPSIKVVAARSKAKAKPQQREPVDNTTTTIPMQERRWIDIEPSKQNLASYDLSKKVINLLRHNQTLQREEDGAIEFYKIKCCLRNHHSQI